MNSDICYIIIVNFNSFINTSNCIKSILFSTYKNYKIVIVDNCSTDNSYKLLNEKFKEDFKVTLLNSENNKGYGYGINFGIKFSMENTDCKFFWILNNDTKVFPDSLGELVKSDNASKKHTIWGSKILNENGTIQSLGCVLNTNFMNTYHNFENNRDSESQFHIDRVDYIHGCSIFLNNEVALINGYFSEQYFLFYEDVDYSLRATQKKISLKISQKSKVIHKGNSTIKKYNFEYLSTLNRIKFSKIHFPENILLVYLGVLYEIIKNIFFLRFYRNYHIISKLVK